MKLNRIKTEGSIATQRRVWDEEYSIQQVIPSSTRTLPSKPLLLFSELLDFNKRRKVLDAGCGNGRNSIFFAQRGSEVHAVDFSPIAIKKTNLYAKEEGVSHNIRTYSYYLSDHFPFEDQTFDLVLDSYVSCHFIDKDFKANYLKELCRVTKLDGFVYSSVFFMYFLI